MAAIVATTFNATLLSAQETPDILKPNVVIILADDTGYSDLSCYGNKRVETPRMDSLATNGLRFTDGHSPSSVCSPSRYNLITGRHSWRTYAGMGNFWMGSNPMPIEADRLTLPKLFKKHGYRTACIGKWHLSFGDENNPITDYTVPLMPGPLEVGFDYFFGIPHVGQTPHIYIRNHDALDAKTGRPLREIFRETGETPPPSGITYQREPGGRQQASGDKNYVKYFYHHEDLAVRLTEEAVDYIENAPTDHPFLLYFPHRNTHGPIRPNARFQKTGNTYSDFLLELDWSVGEVLDALERKGIADKTVVIFSSDNGGVGANSNLPLRGNKTLSFEGGHRVPFIVKWPGQVKAGTVSNQLVALTNLLATFAEYFDEALPDDAGEDSFSFLPSLLNIPPMSPTRQFLVSDGLNGRTWGMRRGKWMLILPNEDPEALKENDYTLAHLSKEGDRVKHPMLFDLEADLSQKHDVAAEHPEMVAEMRQLLETIKSSSSRAAAR